MTSPIFRNVLNRDRRLLGYVDVAALTEKWEAGTASPNDSISKYMTKFNRSASQHYIPITPLTPLAELAEFPLPLLRSPSPLLPRSNGINQYITADVDAWTESVTGI
ncbi:hypothetical protein BDR03DRAFT_1017086 [Suillus americanus]|nr:hypothetical protein BDR03DRAFT_1017086 [Suillus americanus]